MDSKTEQRLNEMRAKYAASAQAQQEQRRSAQSTSTETRRESQPQKTSGGAKGFWLTVAAIGAGVALWFGGQKHGETKAGAGREDAALNNRPTLNQVVDGASIEGQKPAGMTMVDLQQAGGAQQNGGDVVEQTPDPRNDKPMTRQEQIRMLELARDKKMRECAAAGNPIGAAKAQREYEEARQMLTGHPTKADARAAVQDARDMARAAADISASGARVAYNTRDAADNVGRMQTVDPARRNAEVAKYNATEASARHVEAREQNMTLEERLRVVQHAADGVSADVRAMKGMVDSFRNFNRR